VDTVSVFRSATRTIAGAALAFALACGSGAAMIASADHPRRSGTVLVSVSFHGSTGKGVVTVFTGGGRRIARHVVHQSIPNFQGVVSSRFVLKPGHYTLKLTPRSGLWARCGDLDTVRVRAGRTTAAALGYPCASY
jgi:hypothetical protein